jgi:chemotaxis response regulator CheB
MPRRNIVVVRASAGGIDVLQTVVSSLPWDFPGAVFIVLHTSEDSPGLLPEILNRSSRVPALDAVHNAPILPSRIHVAPPGNGTCCSSREKFCCRPGLAKTAANLRSTVFFAQHHTPMVARSLE